MGWTPKEEKVAKANPNTNPHPNPTPNPSSNPNPNPNPTPNPSRNPNPNPNPDQALKAAVAKLGPETPNRWDKVAKG